MKKASWAYLGVIGIYICEKVNRLLVIIRIYNYISFLYKKELICVQMEESPDTEIYI